MQDPRLPRGFVADSQAMLSAKWMVRQFAQRARERRDPPGRAAVQFARFRRSSGAESATTLEADGIPYLSTHELAPADDPRNFLRDGHFARAANQKFAAALQQLIERELSRTTPDGLRSSRLNSLRFRPPGDLPAGGSRAVCRPD